MYIVSNSHTITYEYIYIYMSPCIYIQCHRQNVLSTIAAEALALLPGFDFLFCLSLLCKTFEHNHRQTTTDPWQEDSLYVAISRGNHPTNFGGHFTLSQTGKNPNFTKKSSGLPCFRRFKGHVSFRFTKMSGLKSSDASL